MPTTDSFRITPVYDRLLRGDSLTPMGLYHLHIATAEQLCRLHYSPTSIKAVKARLKDLSDHGYIQADTIPTRNYKSPFYYALAQKGARYLSDLGLDISASFRASKEVGKSYLHLGHTLEVNDMLIAAMLIKMVDSRLVLNSFVHERVLKQQPYQVEWRGRKVSIIPDAYLTFRVSSEDGRRLRFPILLEQDRDTEEKQHFKRRIRSYIIMLKGELYKKLLGVGAITIAFTTFTGSTRLEQMREWTRQELEATNENRAIGVRFHFAALPQPLNPHQAWLEPYWFTPYADDPPHSLFAT